MAHTNGCNRQCVTGGHEMNSRNNGYNNASDCREMDGKERNKANNMNDRMDNRMDDKMNDKMNNANNCRNKAENKNENKSENRGQNKSQNKAENGNGEYTIDKSRNCRD